MLLLKHANLDSVYFSPRAINFNAISKLFIVYEACQYMSYKMTKELLVKRMRDRMFGLRDFMPNER